MARKLNEKTAAHAAEKAASSAPKGERAKAGKAKTSAAKIVSNVTDETIVAAVMECGGFKSELESAQGKYRNALKKWEERGVDAADIAWILRTKQREVHDIENEFRRRNRLLRVLKIPVGAQLGLFEDGESVASKVDGDAVKSEAEKAKIVEGDEIARAQAKGYDAGLRDYGEDVNPHEDGSPLALAWEAGRKSGVEQRQRVGAAVTGKGEATAGAAAG